MTRLRTLGVAMTIAIASAIVSPSARADATVTLCDVDDEIGPVPHGLPVNLSDAINIGGNITFDCPHTTPIKVTHAHAVNKPTIIDGGARGVTLKVAAGGDTALIFDSGPGLTLKNLTLIGNGSGIAVYTLGAPLFVTAVKIQQFRVGLASSASLLNIADSTSFETLDWGIVSHGNTVANISNASFQSIRFSPIRFFGGPLNIDGVRVESSGQSTFEAQGGPTCNVNISHSYFGNNTAVNAEGGAVLFACDASVDHTDFRQNSATQGGGAVKVVDGAANVSFRTVKFIGNKSSLSGGAISVTHGSSVDHVKLQLQYVSFLRNQAFNAGGAIYYLGTSSAQLLGAELLFDGNTGRGGGAVWWPVGVVDIDRGIFVRNSSLVLGGGIVHYGVLGPSALSNCLFTGNSAAGGSAVHGRGLRLINCTIAGNSGSAVLGADGPGPTEPVPPADRKLAIINSIVVGNNGGNCAFRDGVSFVDQGHNLQFPDASCAGTIAVADPKLDSLFVPGYFSPALAAGDNPVCSAPPVRNRDVYGQPRPQGSVCTIGAVEGELQQVLYQRRYRDIRKPSWWNWDAMFGKSCCK